MQHPTLIRSIEIEELKEELTAIRKEMHSINESMPDKDMFLSTEESKLLEESYLNEKEGKLTSGKDIKKSWVYDLLDNLR